MNDELSPAALALLREIASAGYVALSMEIKTPAQELETAGLLTTQTVRLFVGVATRAGNAYIAEHQEADHE